MFKNLKLSAKLVGAIILVLSVSSGISFWISQRIFRPKRPFGTS